MTKLLIAALMLAACLAFQAWATQAQNATGNGEGEALPPLSVVFTPRHQAVLAAEVATTVLEIHKEFGESFEQGDLLIKLDSERFVLDRNRAGSRVAAASKSYKVNKELYDNDSASQLEVEEARRDLGVAGADYNIAEHDIDSCTVTAPFGGRVDKVLVNEFEQVQKGQPMMEIVNDSVLLVKTLLPSKAFRSVSVGKDVSIQVNELGETVAGKVSHISATMDPASGTFEIYAEVDNAEGLLRSGMTGQLVLPDLQ